MTSHPSLTSHLLAAVDSAEAIQQQFDLDHREALERCAQSLATVLGRPGLSEDSEPSAGARSDGWRQQLLAPLAPPRQSLEKLTLEGRFDLEFDRQRAGFLGVRPLGIGYGKRFATTTTSSTTFRVEVVAVPRGATVDSEGASPDPSNADP